MNWEEISRMQGELEEFASYEGSEAGEYWSALTNFGSRTDMMSKEFEEVYIKELKSTLEWVKDNFELVEKEYTHTYKRKELVEK